MKTVQVQAELKDCVRQIVGKGYMCQKKWYIYRVQDCQVALLSPALSLEFQVSEGISHTPLLRRVLVEVERAEATHIGLQQALEFIRDDSQVSGNHLGEYVYSFEEKVSAFGVSVIYRFSYQVLILGSEEYVLCQIQPTSYSHIGGARINLLNNNSVYWARLGEGVWVRKPAITLTDEERLLLVCTMQGVKEEAVRRNLGLSIGQLKRMKTNLRERFHVSSTAQLITRAIIFGLV